MALRKKFIRSTVENLLSKVSLEGAPVDLDAVAKVLSLEISEQTSLDDDISGCLIRRDDGRNIIGVNAAQHPNRKRFTIAHEIGHYLLHKGEEYHLDRAPSFRINFRDTVSSAAVDENEMEANLFAAELLMPADFLARDLESGMDLADDSDQGLQTLANRYGVSAQALTYRLMNLGLLPA